MTDEELESWLFGDIDEEPVTGDVEIEGPVAEGHIGRPRGRRVLMNEQSLRDLIATAKTATEEVWAEA